MQLRKEDTLDFLKIFALTFLSFAVKSVLLLTAVLVAVKATGTAKLISMESAYFIMLVVIYLVLLEIRNEIGRGK